jgi:glutamate-1-semialdehyde aminotransferase
MRERDVLLPPSHNEVMFLSTAHGDDDVAHTLRAIEGSLLELRSKGTI